MSNTGIQGKQSYALALVIAVTGHRDLLEAVVAPILERVKLFLSELQIAYPSRKIGIMSPLAEGADSLVAKIAIAMSLDPVVPPPKPLDSYLQDFQSDAARLRFKAAVCHTRRPYQCHRRQGIDQAIRVCTTSLRGAHQRLQLATDDIEKRQVLYALGQSALNENADWILMHRERSVEHGEIWRMGSWF